MGRSGSGSKRTMTERSDPCGYTELPYCGQCPGMVFTGVSQDVCTGGLGKVYYVIIS